MPSINTGPVQEVLKALRNDVFLQNLLGKDKNNVLSIRPEHFIPTGQITPEVTIAWNNGKSNSLFPATEDSLRLTLWLDQGYKEPYKTLEAYENEMESLFNRKGFQYNNIDVPTDTGIRFCQFVKLSATKAWDNTEKKFYSEIVFKVNLSETESFDPNNAGDKAWT
jgi:hypothetical protein